MSGDQQVQSRKGDTLYGFYEFNDVPRKFKSGADYIAYKKGLLANKYRANVIASGDIPPTMGLTNAINITSKYLANEPFQLNDGTVKLDVWGMDFYFYGSNYGRNKNGGIWLSANNVLSFGAGTSISGENNISGIRGIFIGLEDREIEEIYFVPSEERGNFVVFKIIVFQHNYGAESEKSRFEIRLVKEASGYFRQWIEVQTSIANPTTGFFNIQKQPGNQLQYAFGTQYAWNSQSSFVLASNQNGDNWKLFDHCHLTV
jgi:hypothetical protein